MPDIRREPEAWFRHFDRNGNGLEQHEVVDAVSQTFPGADRTAVREMIRDLWSMFDPDRSGSISLWEFTRQGGLRECLIAQMGGAAAPPRGGMAAQPQPGRQHAPHSPGAPDPSGYPVQPGPGTGGGGVHRAGVEDELEAMFPHAGLGKIREALARCRGDKAAAADMLRRGGGGPASRPPAAGASPGGPPVVMGQVVSGPPAGHVAVGRPIAPGGARPAGPPGGGPMPVAVTGFVPKMTGRKKAVLIGINYFGTQAELRGCINDVHNMKRLLVQTFRWPESCFQVLTDDNPRAMPTKANIVAAMRWLVQDVKPGDVLFFHFSGHGAQREDPNGFEEDGMNETILPVDFKHAGMMSDDEMSHIIVHSLPEGARLTCVMDSCHSGTGMDLPFQFTGGFGRPWREETNPCHSLGDVQLFSGCQEDSTSADSSGYGRAGGAMTTAFCDVLRSGRVLTYPELMAQLNNLMRSRGFSQVAQLSSSQAFDPNRPFLLEDVHPNINPQIGRIFRRRFPPRPRPMEGPLADMLGIGAAVVGGLVLADLAGGLLGALF